MDGAPAEHPLMKPIRSEALLTEPPLRKPIWSEVLLTEPPLRKPIWSEVRITPTSEVAEPPPLFLSLSLSLSFSLPHSCLRWNEKGEEMEAIYRRPRGGDGDKCPIS